jgi:hypothetical protein
MTPTLDSRWLLAFLAMLLAGPSVRAQTTIEPPAVSPGARSLGLGGAFVATADDATAGWVNPSGLMQLVRPELSFEGRSWNEDREGVASNSSSLGFLSFVLPRKTWSIAFYGQTLSSLDFSGDWQSAGTEPDPISGLVLANAGVSAAIRLSDALSIGFGLTAFAGTVSGIDFEDPQSYPFFEEDVQTEPGANAGVLWNVSESWAIGAAARTGVDVTFSNGSRAVFPDIVSAGARWRSESDNAIVSLEIEHLSGLSDRVRPHVGGEWVFLTSKPLIGLRAGMWYDPEGAAIDVQRVDGSSDDDGVVHTSLGIGFAWKRFQLDLAADLSSRTTISSISGIVTF